MAALRNSRYAKSAFSLAMAGIVSIFVAIPPMNSSAIGNKTRGLAVLKWIVDWLLVEPLGRRGAILAVMVAGICGAWAFFPRVGKNG